MRLQSAVFSLEDTVLDPSALPEYRARQGLDKVLSILKMGGVWLYAVTALPRAAAREALEKTGLAGTFRGIVTEAEANCRADSGTMFEKAARRLHSGEKDTVIFAGHLTAVENARAAGFRAVAVRGCADEQEWQAMRVAATEALESYEEYLG